MVPVGHGLVEHRRVDLGEDHRLARARNGIAADGGIRRRRVSIAQLLDQRDPVGVSMRDHQWRQPAVRLEQIDRAPIGDAGHDQFRDLPQRCRGIERCPEDPTGLGHVRRELDLVGVANAVSGVSRGVRRSGQGLAAPSGCRR